MRYEPFVRFGGGTIGSSPAAQVLEEKLQIEDEKTQYKLMKILTYLSISLNDLKKAKDKLSKYSIEYILRLISQDINQKLKEIKSWLNFDTYSYFENVVLTKLKIFRRENLITGGSRRRKKK